MARILAWCAAVGGALAFHALVVLLFGSAQVDPAGPPDRLVEGPVFLMDMRALGARGGRPTEHAARIAEWLDLNDPSRVARVSPRTADECLAEALARPPPEDVPLYPPDPLAQDAAAGPPSPSEAKPISTARAVAEALRQAGPFPGPWERPAALEKISPGPRMRLWLRTTAVTIPILDPNVVEKALSPPAPESSTGLDVYVRKGGPLRVMLRASSGRADLDQMAVAAAVGARKAIAAAAAAAGGQDADPLSVEVVWR